jgi:hypothetical protein
MENINSASENTDNRLCQVKSKIWDNRTNRLTLLFIIAALLISVFFYHQYARRHFTLSSSSQRLHNH